MILRKTKFLILLFVVPLSFGLTIFDAQAKTCRVENYSKANISDGRIRTPDQAQIQRAINDCAGKGEVILKEDKIYTIGTIELKSGTNLNLNGATILLSSQKDCYWTEGRNEPALIDAISVKNITINGPGLIKRDEELKRGMTIMKFSAVENVKLKNFKIDTSRADWNSYEGFHILFSAGTNHNGKWQSSKDITIDGITIRGRIDKGFKKHPWGGNDGIHIQNSKDVLIKNCDIQTSDDGIVVTTPRPDPVIPGMFGGSISKNLKEKLALENFRAENCKVSSISSALKFGTGTFADIRNVTFQNIKIYSMGRAIRAISFYLHGGGNVEHVKFKDITIKKGVEKWFSCGGLSGGGCKWGYTGDYCYGTCFRSTERQNTLNDILYSLGEIKDIVFENINQESSWTNISFKNPVKKTITNGKTTFSVKCDYLRPNCNKKPDLNNWRKRWKCCNSSSIIGNLSPDLNNDNKVNVIDLGILLSGWNKGNQLPDLNKDGWVDSSDVVILLTNWS